MSRTPIGQPRVFDTPGHECAHADKGACPLCRTAHPIVRLGPLSGKQRAYLADAIKRALRTRSPLSVHL